MPIEGIETDFIELFIVLIIFVASYFLATKMFHFKEHVMLITSIFALFMIFMLLAFDYKLYISFTIIIFFAIIVLYTYIKQNNTGVDAE